MTPELRHRIETALGTRVRRSLPLRGGNIAQATRIETDDGRNLVVKHMVPRPQSPHPIFGTLPKATLKDEAFMLDRLRQTGAVPVPEVVHVTPDLLILTFIDCDQDALSNTGQAALADVLTALHAHTAPRFGFDRPGSAPQCLEYGLGRIPARSTVDVLRAFGTAGGTVARWLLRRT